MDMWKKIMAGLACILLACTPAVASPYLGKVFITGVYDAEPVDESDSNVRQYNYKAIEFFSTVALPASEMPNFTLSILQDTLSSNTPVLLAFPGGSGVAAYSRFYAVADMTAFQNLYSSSASPNWQDRNQGAPNVQYEGLQIQVMDGNEVIQLLHSPGGNPLSTVPLDTYGLVDTPYFDSAPIVFGDAGIYVWGFENGWAYRNLGTSGSGGSFAPEDWTFSSPGRLDNMGFAQTTTDIPFGTFVPEPASGLLILIGAFALRLLRARGGYTIARIKDAPQS